MAGSAILTSLNYGIPGHLSRPYQGQDVTTVALDSTIPPLAFGVPYKLASGLAAKIEEGDSASDVSGFLVRSTVEHMPTSNQALGATTPNPAYHHGGLQSGYMFATCYGSTAPAADTPVYLRVSNADGSHPIGGLEAAAAWTVTRAAKDGGNTGTETCTLASPAYTSEVQAGVYEVRCIAVTDGSAAASAVANAANTGNATIGTVTPTSAARFGLYNVVFTAATAFDVYYPDGTLVGTGATGSAFSGGGLGFTITAGATPMVASDSFTIAVTDIGVSVWSVTDPNGAALANAKSGTAYTTQIKFTIAEAGLTKAVVGDGFDVTVEHDAQPIPGAYWAGGRDPSNNAEIRYNKA